MSFISGRSSKRPTSADDRWMIISTTSYIFAGFYDNTVIYRNGAVVLTLNKQQLGTIELDANDIISSNRPISFSRVGSGQTGLCYAWAGTAFAHSFDRYTVSIYIVATDQPANVTIVRGGDLGNNFFSGTVSTTAYTTVSVGTTYDHYIIESDNPIAVYVGELPSNDCMPLYPASLEIYGTASSNGHMIALYDGTTITESDTAGNSTSRALNRGQSSGFSYAGGSQFTGSSTKLTANNPICAESQGDGDGGEMTPYISKEGFGKMFVVPENEREFTKIVSDQPAVVKAYDSTGTLLSTTTLTGSSTNGIYNALLTGTSSYERVLLISDVPVYCIYEGEDDDETVLFAHYPDEFSVSFNPSIVTDSLELALDAANPKSYPGSGSTWYDLSGNNHNGTFVGNTAFSSAFKGLVQFDGSGDYVDFSTAPGFNAVDFSVVCWYRTADTSMRLVQNRSTGSFGTNAGWQISVTSSTMSNTSFDDGAGNAVSFSISSAPFVDNNWHCLVITWDTSTGVGKLYLDGELQETITNTALIGANLDSDDNLQIGRANSNTQYLNGDVSQVMIYNKVLSDWEVRKNFNSSRGRYQ